MMMAIDRRLLRLDVERRRLGRNGMTDMLVTVLAPSFARPGRCGVPSKAS